MTIYIKGREMDADKYIHALQKEINDNQCEIDKLVDARHFVLDAIAEHYKTAYIKLDKTLNKYGGVDGLHEAYGYRWISRAKFDELTDMAKQREHMREIIQNSGITDGIDRKISVRQATIRALRNDMDMAEQLIMHGEQNE